MNDALKALADPTRREILRLLAKGEKRAGELADRFDMTKPSVSHHFSVLKAADLIRCRRDGRELYYTLNTTVVQDVASSLLELFSGKSRPNESTSQEKS